MDVDEIRSEIEAVKKQLDYLDDIFEKERIERQRIDKEQNCFCKFLDRIFNRDLRYL